MFEAQGILWVDGLVLDLIPESLRELALKIESQMYPRQKLFVVLEKNYSRNYTLFYRKKFYKEVSVVADYLPAYFLKLYGKGILTLFDLYY